MNKLMYTALACSLIFLAVCIGIRLKGNTTSSLPTKPSTPTKEPDKIDKSTHEEIMAIVKKTEESVKTASIKKASHTKGPILAIAGLKNIAQNPSANNGIENWKTMNAVTIENTSKKNPFFSLRNKGRLKQKIKLHNADMQYVVVVACGSAPRTNKDTSDPAGLPLVRIYFEDYANKANTADETALVMTSIRQNGWGQIGVVKQIPANSQYLHLELHQATGKSPVTNVTKFDDVNVFIARNKESGNKMLASYVKQAQAFSR
jgi:hypothetical protein